jgi:hypothetical protein
MTNASLLIVLGFVLLYLAFSGKLDEIIRVLGFTPSGAVTSPQAIGGMINPVTGMAYGQPGSVQVIGLSQ